MVEWSKDSNSSSKCFPLMSCPYAGLCSVKRVEALGSYYQNPTQVKRTLSRIVAYVVIDSSGIKNSRVSLGWVHGEWLDENFRVAEWEVCIVMFVLQMYSPCKRTVCCSYPGSWFSAWSWVLVKKACTDLSSVYDGTEWLELLSCQEGP